MASPRPLAAGQAHDADAPAQAPSGREEVNHEVCPLGFDPVRCAIYMPAAEKPVLRRSAHLAGAPRPRPRACDDCEAPMMEGDEGRRCFRCFWCSRDPLCDMCVSGVALRQVSSRFSLSRAAAVFVGGPKRKREWLVLCNRKKCKEQVARFNVLNLGRWICQCRPPRPT